MAEINDASYISLSRKLDFDVMEDEGDKGGRGAMDSRDHISILCHSIAQNSAEEAIAVALSKMYIK